MKRWLGLLLLTLTGCSTAPVADFMDLVAPARFVPDAKVQPYGGVCQPQGGPVGVGPPAPGVPAAPGFPAAPSGPTPRLAWPPGGAAPGPPGVPPPPAPPGPLPGRPE